MNDRVIQGLDSLPASVRAGVLTIGNFDGVHLGHQRIIATARALADAEGLAVVAMTFEPPPDRVLRPADVPQRITPPEEKARLLLAAGCDRVVFARSAPGLFDMTGQEFIKRVVVGRLGPRHVVEGRNFFFGRRRGGNTETLRAAGEAAGFGVHVAEPVLVDLSDGRDRVSSTLIRRLVAGGRIEDANRCLGRDFALYGGVVAGRQRGRLLDMPTCNLDAGEQVCPSDGVYAAGAEVGGRRFPAAVSIGARPTFGQSDRAVEAHLIGAAGDFYEQYLALHFFRRLRGQVRFDGPEALRRQIKKDIESARRIYEQRNAGG